MLNADPRDQTPSSFSLKFPAMGIALEDDFLGFKNRIHLIKTRNTNTHLGSSGKGGLIFRDGEHHNRGCAGGAVAGQ